MIEIYNLWKSFGNKVVLKGLSLEIKTGEVMVIIGRSGCGKSVLLKHIVRLIKQDKGEIYIDGLDINKFSRDQLNKLREKCGILFQGAALFDSLTVRENVGFFLYENTKLPKERIAEIVTQKLKLVGLEGVEDIKPSQLSGGMKKRVGLARAIATDPKIILYDEPTTGVDPIMAARINKLIRKLQDELSLTSIVVTHDINSAYHIADRIGMLYEGKIIEIGTPSEIKGSQNPIVKQFVEGKDEGPIKIIEEE